MGKVMFLKEYILICRELDRVKLEQTRVKKNLEPLEVAYQEAYEISLKNSDLSDETLDKIEELRLKLVNSQWFSELGVLRLMLVRLITETSGVTIVNTNVIDEDLKKSNKR